MTVLRAPHVETRAAVPTAGISRRVSMNEIGSIGGLLPVVEEWLGARGVAPAGPPFFRYHIIDMARELHVEGGWPIPETVALDSDGEVAVSTMPAGRYAVALHQCRPDELVQATADLLTWADAEGHTFDRHDTPDGDAWAGRFERYLTDPGEEPDMSKWETELAFKLVD